MVRGYVAFDIQTAFVCVVVQNHMLYVATRRYVSHGGMRAAMEKSLARAVFPSPNFGLAISIVRTTGEILARSQ